MSNRIDLLSKRDLEAYADGLLDENRGEAVDQWLRENPRALFRVFDIARLNAELRRAKAVIYQNQELREELDLILQPREPMRKASSL